MTRRRLLLGLLAALVPLPVMVWLLWPHPSAITMENVAKIKSGMTLAEVEALLGGPARDDSKGPALAGVNLEGFELALKEAKEAKEWVSDEVRVKVWLDEKDRVSGFVF